ncbi:MAG TPA: RnfABCDGE type electron transport complex subunit D [Tepidisphaeraceae bacterium]|nr:RnfABCDGE type electron transport complex subunit D [Tepidisphaeraceae bacterium]
MIRVAAIASGRTMAAPGVTHFIASSLQGLALPIVVGMIAFGWRAAIVAAGVGVIACAAAGVFRRVAPGALPIRLPHVLLDALLLAAMLPAEWAGGTLVLGTDAHALWPLVGCAGLLVAMLTALRALVGSMGVDPVIVSYLLLAAAAGPALAPSGVLRYERALRGDVLDVAPADARPTDHDAIRAIPPVEQLHAYTAGLMPLDQSWLTIESLLRDRLPPLEDLILAQSPAPLGSASVVAVLMGGLLLAFRGVAEWRVAAMVLGSAYVALLVMPVPVVITEAGPRYYGLAAAMRSVGIDVALTLVHYELISGLIPWCALFLATRRELCPIQPRARWVYAILIGLLASALQRYVAPYAAAPAAVLVAALLAGALDRWLKPRPLL